MNGDDAERLPEAIGPLVDLALHAYGKNIVLASLLSIGAFLVQGAVALVLARTPDVVLIAAPLGQAPTATAAAPLTLQLLITLVVGIFVDSFVIGVVALAVAAVLGGARLEPRTLLRGALYRLAGVFGATFFASAIVELTLQSGGLDPDAAPWQLLLAPITWLLWGAVGLAGPIAALSPDIPIRSAFIALGRSLTISLRTANLGRLCIVAFATVVPILGQAMLAGYLTTRATTGASFWANVPIDALTVGPLAALQTVFALDFARRIARTDAQRR